MLSLPPRDIHRLPLIEERLPSNCGRPISAIIPSSPGWSLHRRAEHTLAKNRPPTKPCGVHALRTCRTGLGRRWWRPAHVRGGVGAAASAPQRSQRRTWQEK